MTDWNRKISILCLLLVTFVGTGSAGLKETHSRLLKEAHITVIPWPKKTHDFVLPDVNGKEFRLQEFRGQIVFLNIWATWCGPCRAEMPSIEKLHQHFKDEDLTILTVSVDMADIEVVKAFLEKHGYTFTVLHDPRGNIMEWFRVRLIPVTYLIDRSGKIIAKAVGPRDWSQDAMIRLFEVLLKESEKP
jgi:peroxiredoxin